MLSEAYIYSIQIIYYYTYKKKKGSTYHSFTLLASKGPAGLYNLQREKIKLLL